jgi:hypothetical protein
LHLAKLFKIVFKMFPKYANNKAYYV